MCIYCAHLLFYYVLLLFKITEIGTLAEQWHRTHLSRIRISSVSPLRCFGAKPFSAPFASMLWYLDQVHPISLAAPYKCPTANLDIRFLVSTAKSQIRIFIRNSHAMCPLPLICLNLLWCLHRPRKCYFRTHSLPTFLCLFQRETRLSQRLGQPFPLSWWPWPVLSRLQTMKNKIVNTSYANGAHRDWLPTLSMLTCCCLFCVKSAGNYSRNALACEQ